MYRYRYASTNVIMARLFQTATSELLSLEKKMFVIDLPLELMNVHAFFRHEVC